MKKAIKTLKKKLIKGNGFSLVEMLFSILILMLSTTIIIQCFNLGIANIVRETRASEAQLLCSALTSSLQNELTYAQNIKIKADNTLDSYFSASRRMGEGSSIIVDSNGELKIQNASEVYPLVASSNYTVANRAGVGGGGYFLKAYLDGGSIQWDPVKKVFNVTLWVDDAKKEALTAENAATKALAYSKFSVKPLAGVK